MHQSGHPSSWCSHATIMPKRQCELCQDVFCDLKQHASFTHAGKQEHIAQGTQNTGNRSIIGVSFSQNKQWIDRQMTTHQKCHSMNCFSRLIVMQPFDKSTIGIAKAIESLCFPSKESSVHENIDLRASQNRSQRLSEHRLCCKFLSLSCKEKS